MYQKEATRQLKVAEVIVAYFLNFKNLNIMFKIGQKVVCKSIVGVYGIPYGIIKDKIYTIENIICCPRCNNTVLVLLGVDSGSKKICSCSYNGLPTNAFAPWRFEPIKYQLVSNIEIIKEIITERSDIPVEEPALNQYAL